MPIHDTLLLFRWFDYLPISSSSMFYKPILIQFLSQIIRRKQVTVYLDGAHTEHSMQACVSWVNQQMQVLLLSNPYIPV